MSEAAFNRVDSFSSVLEASDQLWNVVRVDMAETELPVLVVLSNCVDKALLANEEAKVVTTRYSCDINLFAEGHLDGSAVLLSTLLEGPCVCFSHLITTEGQVASCSH